MSLHPKKARLGFRGIFIGHLCKRGRSGTLSLAAVPVPFFTAAEDRMDQIPPSAAYFLVSRDDAYVYPRVNLEEALVGAKADGIPFTQVGGVLDCPSLPDLENLYGYLYGDVPHAENYYILSSPTQLTEIGPKVWFKVKGYTVLVLTLAKIAKNPILSEPNEAASEAVVWLPTFSALNELDDQAFDSVHCVRLG